MEETKINRESNETFHSEKIDNQYQSLTEDISQKQKAQRLNSLDVLRGLTMLGMILVDNQGPSPPWWLDHAEWNGVTPADFIFPSFIFIMGMAIPLSLTESKPFGVRNVTRILGLFGIGVLINLSARKFNIHHFRIIGILQRLSLCYGILSLIHWATRYAKQGYRFLGLLFTIFLSLTYLSFMLSFSCEKQKNLTPECNFGAYIDQHIFGKFHMIFPNDPEGLFTTINAVINGYVGYYFCLIMKDHKQDTFKILKLWTLTGVICIGCGFMLEQLMPFNKKIWSTSFVMLTAGVSGLSLTILTIAVDIFGNTLGMYSRVVKFISKPFIWLGRNPLIIFILMDVVAIIMIKYIVIEGKNSWGQFYHYAFATWIHNPQLCSVIFSLFFATVWICVAGLFHRFKIFIRL